MITLSKSKAVVMLQDCSVYISAKYYWSDPILVQVISKHMFMFPALKFTYRG